MVALSSGYCITMTSPVLDELLKIERAGWDSLCESSGADFYGEVMLPDAVMVLANGMVMDRNTVVSALAQSPPWRAYELSGVHLVTADDDNAALVYQATAYRDDDEPAFVGAMSSVYHRSPDGWKLVLYQQTRKPDQPTS